MQINANSLAWSAQSVLVKKKKIVKNNIVKSEKEKN